MRLLFQWNNHGISFVDLQFCSVSQSGNNEEKRCPIKEDPLLLILKFLSTTLLVIGILFSPIIKNSIARSTLYSINRICYTDLNFSFISSMEKKISGNWKYLRRDTFFGKFDTFFLEIISIGGIGRAGKQKETVADPCLNARVDFDEAQSERIFLFLSMTNGLHGDFQLTNREKIEPMDRSDENSLRPNIERYGSWSWIRPTTITG